MIDALLEMIYENNPLLMMGAGLIIGLLHAFEPDHLSSVYTQMSGDSTTRYKKTSLKILGTGFAIKGMLWGAGHTFSIVLIGLLVVGLSLHISDSFFIGAEFVVGFMLITLGVITVANRGILSKNHVHPHKHHNGTIHTHSHGHDERHKHGHRFYLIGCIHGIAGSGGLVALTASTMPSFDMVLYFLILFGGGSVIGMTVASGLVGLPFIMLPKIGLAAKYMRYAMSGIALIIGFNIIFTLLKTF